MLDKTMILETPLLCSAYGHVPEQAGVPIKGSRAKRIMHGAIKVKSADVGPPDHPGVDQRDSPGFPRDGTVSLKGLNRSALRRLGYPTQVAE
jgi:hypothetical protein